MKKQFILMSAVALLGFSACSDGDSDSTTGTDSTSTTTTTRSTSFESRSFKDLRTGNPINIRRDTITWKYVDANTGAEVGFYFDPTTNDTFDSRGYILNNALIADNGNWTIQEDIVVQNPENIKIKEAEMKIKIDGDDLKIKTDSTKLKQDGDSYKEKTDSTKIKVTDKKVKVKDK